jgi:hypothetical protein
MGEGKGEEAAYDAGEVAQDVLDTVSIETI